MTDPTEPEYGLVMPFVACEDQGGPYEAGAFVAGYEAGTTDLTLKVIAPMGGSFDRWVPPGLVPQLDLIAMRHGYSTTTEPWDEHPDEYVHITYTPPGHDPKEDDQ